MIAKQKCVSIYTEGKIHYRAVFENIEQTRINNRSSGFIESDIVSILKKKRLKTTTGFGKKEPVFTNFSYHLNSVTGAASISVYTRFSPAIPQINP